MTDSNSVWDDIVNQSLTDNPRIKNSPGLAMDTIQSQDPTTTAPLLVHSAMGQAAQQAAQDHLAENQIATHWWDGAVHSVASAAGWMAKPLNEIQKDYRYIHSLYTRHGVITGTLGLMAVVGGATAGTLLGGPMGTALGADLAAAGLRTLGGHLDQFKDSYNDSNDPNYKVSFGRDAANALGANGQTDSGWGKFVSGALDATFDIYLDPLMKIGAAKNAVRSGKWVKTERLLKDGEKARYIPMAFRGAGVQDFLSRNSLKTFGDADKLEKLWASANNPTLGDRLAGSGRNYKRALEELVTLDAAEVGFKFPALRAISEEIGAAKTAEDVHKVFLSTQTEQEIIDRFAFGGVPVMPSRTVLRQAISRNSDRFLQPGNLDDTAYELGNAANFIIPRKVFKGREFNAFMKDFTDKALAAGTYRQGNMTAAQELDTITNAAKIAAKSENFNKVILPLALRPFDKEARYTAIAKKVRTLSGYQPMWISDDLKQISTSEFDPHSNSANNVIYSLARYSMGHRSALRFVNEWSSAKLKDEATGLIEGAPDLSRRREVYLGLLSEAVKAAGFPNDGKAFSDLIDHLGSRLTGTIGGTAYGYGAESAHGVSTIGINGASHQAALHSHQVGNWALPDFREFSKAMRSMNDIGQMYGRVDEFVAKQWTDSIFKPFALLTAGFGFRVATSELIPAMVRFGGIQTAMGKVAISGQRLNYNLAKDHVATVAESMGYKLFPGEADHILAHASLALSGNATDYTGGELGQQLAAKFAEAAKTAGSDKAFLEAQAKAATRKIVKNTLGEDVEKIVTGKAVKQTIAKGLSGIANEYDLRCAAEIAIMTQGHMGTGATLTSHGIDTDLNEQIAHSMHLAGQRAKARMKDPSGAYRYWTPGDDHFKVFWLTNLQKQSQNVSGQSMAKDFIRALDNGVNESDAWAMAQAREKARIAGHHFDPTAPEGLGTKLAKVDDLYNAERSQLVRYGAQTPEDFAYARVDDFRNLVTGVDGTLHTGLIRKIANGSKPLADDISGIAAGSSPSAVIGNELVPYTGNQLMRRIAQSGFKKVIDPIVGHMSREPIFFQHYKLAMENYRVLMEKGIVSHETGVRLAATAATHSMVPQIHNPALRTQFSILARNYLPFYFAQEQATKRYIKLASDNPQALRAYQLIEHGISDPGFIHTDDQGNKFLVVPGIGEISAGLLTGAAAIGMPVVGGLPVSVNGSMQSLNTVLPELTTPGVSPFVSVAGNWLVALDPHLGKYVKPVIGDIAYGQQPLDALIPSSPARAWFKALTADERDRTFNNAMLSAIAAANYHGQLPPANASPMEQQAFLDKIKNNARSILIIKGLLGTISPLAPQVSQEDAGLRDEFYKLVKEKGDYPTALHEFLGKHGSGAVSYTVARTEATMPGANMPYTTEAINWIQENEKLINSDKAAAAVFLIPQGATSGDAQVIHDELLKMHLRSRRTSDEFMKAVYTSTGNNQYYIDKAVHDERAKTLQGPALEAENTNWQEYKQIFATTNPVWNNEFQSPEKRNLATLAYSQLSEMFANGTAPAGQQTELVKGLFADYQQHLNNRAAIKNNVSSVATLTEEGQNWQSYLDQVVAQQPLLSTVINGIFRRMD